MFRRRGQGDRSQHCPCQHTIPVTQRLSGQVELRAIVQGKQPDCQQGKKGQAGDERTRTLYPQVVGC